FDLGRLTAERERGRDRLERRDELTPRLRAQAAVDRRLARLEVQSWKLGQPGVAPPQGLRLRPRSVERDDALERARLDRATPAVSDLAGRPLGVGEEHRPSLRIDVLLAQRRSEVPPAQTDDDLRLGQARGHDLRRAEQRVLLLRVLQ